MRTNSAIPIVQQKRGTFYIRMKYNVVRTSLSFFIVCSALAAGYNV